jgi:hypothetical protein
MAKKIAVTWDGSTTSEVVAIDGLDIVGFWDRDDALVGSALTIKTSDENAGTYLSDPVASSDDATTSLTIDLDSGSHNYILISPSTLAGLQRYVYFVSTDSETGVAYLVVRDFR